MVLATADTGFGGCCSAGDQSSSLHVIGGEPLISHVVRACLAAASVEQTLVVGAPDAAGAPFGAEGLLEAGGSPASDIQRALAALDGCSSAVVLPGDVPFVSGAEIDAFISAAAARGAQMAYPLVARAAYEAAFPDVRRTYFRVAEGEVTGGNALFLDVPTFRDNGQILGEAMELRNEPWRLAAMMGPLALLALGRGGISLSQIESAVQDALGIRGAAVIVEAPGLATDIRKPVDLRYARARLGA